MTNWIVGILAIVAIVVLLACGGRSVDTVIPRADTSPAALPVKPAPPRTARPFISLPMFAGTWENVNGREHGSMELFVDGQLVRGTGNNLAVSLSMELGDDRKLHGYLDTNTFERRGGWMIPVKVPLTMELSQDMTTLQVTGPPEWTTTFRRASE